MKGKNYIGLIFLGIVVILISTLFMPFSLISNKSNTNYDFVLRGNVRNDAKIIDIAMLGAHDAFSSDIDMYSKTNSNEGGIVQSQFVEYFAKGFAIRMSKAQNVDAKAMLEAGVRYFDVRVSKIENEYYTFHMYLSNTLKYYLKQIVDYLDTHNGEFIIFDIQHFMTNVGENFSLTKETYQELFDYIASIKNESNKSLLDYIYYNSKADAINSLTYGKITDNGTKAGVILLAKTSDFEYAYLRDSDANYDSSRNYSSIRSYWHNKNNDETMLECINKEYVFVKENKIDDVLVINQAQKTGFISDISLLYSAINWSLLNMANSYNYKLIKDKETYNEYLKYMPILMVDYATSNNMRFNEMVNKYNIEFNRSL